MAREQAACKAFGHTRIEVTYRDRWTVLQGPAKSAGSTSIYCLQAILKWQRQVRLTCCCEATPKRFGLPDPLAESTGCRYGSKLPAMGQRCELQAHSRWLLCLTVLVSTWIGHIDASGAIVGAPVTPENGCLAERASRELSIKGQSDPAVISAALCRRRHDVSGTYLVSRSHQPQLLQPG